MVIGKNFRSKVITHGGAFDSCVLLFLRHRIQTSVVFKFSKANRGEKLVAIRGVVSRIYNTSLFFGNVIPSPTVPAISPISPQTQSKIKHQIESQWR